MARQLNLLDCLNKNMLISHSKKFIFIHNYKVAGTSVRNTLNKYSHTSFENSSGIDRLKMNLGILPKIFSNQFQGHIKATELRSKLPAKLFHDYFKFGFVRNPWDWQVSLYTFALNLKEHHQHEFIKSLKNFDEYIDWRVHKELRLQKDFFYDEDECLVDYIGKFENLDNDFLEVCTKLKINNTLQFLNQSKRSSDYLSYYSPQSINMVYEAFNKDVKLFGYQKPELK